jgi:DNA-binding PadR family transcriptional regulator
MAWHSPLPGALTVKPAITTTMFSILIVLADGDKHGYAIMQAVNDMSDEPDRIGPTTLYRSIRQLENLGAIAEVAQRPRENEDARRRYYRLTASGKETVIAEAQRLAALVKIARSRRSLKWRTV